MHKFAWHGLPASVFQVNMSNAMRVQLPFISAYLDKGDLADSAMGVFGGIVQKATTGSKALARGDYYRVAESFAPEAIAGPMRELRQADRGMTILAGSRSSMTSGTRLNTVPVSDHPSPRFSAVREEH